MLQHLNGQFLVAPNGIQQKTLHWNPHYKKCEFKYALRKKKRERQTDRRQIPVSVLLQE